MMIEHWSWREFLLELGRISFLVSFLVVYTAEIRFLQSQVKRSEANQRSRDRLECQRILFVRHFSPTSTCFSVQEFFSGFGTLDGLPSVFRNPSTNEIMDIVRFLTKSVCEATLLQIRWSKYPKQTTGWSQNKNSTLFT